MFAYGFCHVYGYQESCQITRTQFVKFHLVWITFINNYDTFEFCPMHGCTVTSLTVVIRLESVESDNKHKHNDNSTHGVVGLSYWALTCPEFKNSRLEINFCKWSLPQRTQPKCDDSIIVQIFDVRFLDVTLH